MKNLSPLLAGVLMYIPVVSHAQVTDVALTLFADVNDRLEWDGTFDEFGNPNYVSTGNESFEVSGDIEMLLPFSRTAQSGAVDDGILGWFETTLGGAGGTRSDGVFGFFATSTSGYSESTVLENTGEGSGGLLTFTLQSVYAYEFDVPVAYSSDNDLGSFVIGLRDADGNSIAPDDDYVFVDGSGNFTGELSPGMYSLVFSSTGLATIDFDLRLTPIPAPASMMCLTLTLLSGKRSRS